MSLRSILLPCKNLKKKKSKLLEINIVFKIVLQLAPVSPTLYFKKKHFFCVNNNEFNRKYSKIKCLGKYSNIKCFMIVSGNFMAYF